ncbi:MAG: GNAT family N-acetyltransferase [Hyphomonadaceae bacterium]
MTIRPATVADAAELSRLHTASFEDGWTHDDFATWLARPEAMAVLAIREREAVAFGLALMAGADAELLTIATDPVARQGGLGRQIFRALDAEALNRELERWVLEVARNNLPALGLYKSEGFVEIGVRKGYYKTRQGVVDALVMSRPVGPAHSGQGAA